MQSRVAMRSLSPPRAVTTDFIRRSSQALRPDRVKYCKCWYNAGCRGRQPLHENWRSYQTNQGTGKPLLCLFYAQKKTVLIRKPSLMLSEILLCNKCQSISCNEKLFVCWDNVNLCLRIVCGYLLEYSTAEILLSVNVDTEDIEI